MEPAAASLDSEEPRGSHRSVIALALIAVSIAICFLAGSGAALYLSRDAAERILLQWENVPLPPGGPLRRLPVPLAPISPPADVPDNLPHDSAI
jgi:hypothetical protein